MSRPKSISEGKEIMSDELVARLNERPESRRHRECCDAIGWRTSSSLFRFPTPSSGVVLALRIVNPLAFIAAAAGSALSSRLTGISIGEVSDMYPTPITPAGYAFSIWGLIYFLQANLFMLYQFMPCVNKGLVFRRISWWNLGLCVCSLGWTFSFTYELMELAAAFIWGMLFCLVAIYVRLYTQSGMTTDELRAKRTWVEYAFVYVPWSLYTSWVLGASLINIFIALKVEPGDSIHGGMAAMALAAFVNLMALAWTRDVWFAGVNVWALLAIAEKQQALVPIWTAAAVLATVVGACAVATLVLNILELFDVHMPHKPLQPDRSAPGALSPPSVAI